MINVDLQAVALEKQKLNKLIESKKKLLEPLALTTLDSEQRQYLEDFIDAFELNDKALLENEINLHLANEFNRKTINYQDTKHLDSFFSDTAEDFNDKQHGLSNMISGIPLKKMTNQERDRINNYLTNFLGQRNAGTENCEFDQYFDYKRKLNDLPIHNHRQQLLDLISENRVVVISGETGCGKSTQIPQYILEEMIQRHCGADCSIIVTQPRRLPAISISEQSAVQFGEKSDGDSFGYQIRLDKKLPARDNGVVLFCTTGMLLRKMSGNPYLLGISHLILDEVHERGFLADLTIMLLKKILEKNHHIKLILMSASFNANVFSEYFQNCPIYHIAGRCFPVESIYLDEIESRVGVTPSVSPNKKSGDRVDYPLVCDLIHHINNTKPDNDSSVLCFLPGWSDIDKIRSELYNTARQRDSNAPKLSIIPVHSKLTKEEQQKIFKPLKDGVRKIILSTNITETSLTVPDVVYVIDSGLCNGMNYNENFNVATFRTHLISQASAKQR